MRQAYAHEAVLALPPGADERAPGAAVTAALCGHWEHEPPCPLAPHHVRAARAEGGAGDELHVRILFAAEPEAEREIRHRIDLALSGQWPLPDDLTAVWRLTGSGPSGVTPAEEDHAGRLIRN
jgi:hypothetical protein